MKQRNIGMNVMILVSLVMPMDQKTGKDAKNVNLIITLNIILKIYIIIAD